MAIKINEFVSEFKFDIGDKPLFDLQESVNEIAHDISHNLNKISGPLIGVGAAFSGFAVGAIAAFSGLEKKTQELVGLVGLTQKEADAATQKARELSSAYGEAVGEIQQATFTLASSGQRGVTLMESIEAVTIGAAAGLGDVGEVGNAVAKSMNIFAQQGLTAQEVVDGMTETAKVGLVSAADLATVYPQVGAETANMGVSFQETSGLLAHLSLTSASASQAGTQLGAVVSSLLKPSANLRNVISEAGYTTDTLKEKIGKDGLLQTLVELRESSGKTTVEFSSLFGRKEAVSAIGLMLNNLEGAREKVEQLGDSSNETAIAFEAVNKTFSDAFGQAFHASQDFLSYIGESVAGILKPFLKTFSNITIWASKLLEKAPLLKNMIGTFVSIGAALLPIGIGLKVMAKGLAAVGTQAAIASAKMAGVTFGLSIIIPAITMFIQKLWSARKEQNAWGQAARSIGKVFQAVGLVLKGMFWHWIELGKLIGKVASNLSKWVSNAWKNLFNITPKITTETDYLTVAMQDLGEATSDTKDELLDLANVRLEHIQLDITTSETAIANIEKEINEKNIAIDNLGTGRRNNQLRKQYRNDLKVLNQILAANKAQLEEQKQAFEAVTNYQTEVQKQFKETGGIIGDTTDEIKELTDAEKELLIKLTAIQSFLATKDLHFSIEELADKSNFAAQQAISWAESFDTLTQRLKFAKGPINEFEQELNDLRKEAKMWEKYREDVLNGWKVKPIDASELELKRPTWMEDYTKRSEEALRDLQRKSERIAGDIVNSMEGVVRGNMSIGDAFKDLGIRALRDFAKAFLAKKIAQIIASAMSDGAKMASDQSGGIFSRLGAKMKDLFKGGFGGAADKTGKFLGKIGKGLFGGIGKLFGGAGKIFGGKSALGGILGGTASILGPVGLGLGALSIGKKLFGGLFGGRRRRRRRERERQAALAANNGLAQGEVRINSGLGSSSSSSNFSGSTKTINTSGLNASMSMSVTLLRDGLSEAIQTNQHLHQIVMALGNPSSKQYQNLTLGASAPAATSGNVKPQSIIQGNTFHITIDGAQDAKKVAEDVYRVLQEEDWGNASEAFYNSQRL